MNRIAGRIGYTLMLIMIFSMTAYSQQQFITTASFETKPVLRYPIIGVTPYPSITGNDLKNTLEALTLARELTVDCQCDQALQDYGVNSLSELLQIEVNQNLFDGRSSTLGLPWNSSAGERETVATYFNRNRNILWAGVIPARFTGKGNLVFLNNYFFNPTRAVLMAKEQRAITLIHEVVHQFGGKSDEDFGGSKRLTLILIDACLPKLKVNLKNWYGKAGD
jgi:hypothetical protein